MFRLIPSMPNINPELICHKNWAEVRDAMRDRVTYRNRNNDEINNLFEKYKPGKALSLLHFAIAYNNDELFNEILSISNTIAFPTFNRGTSYYLYIQNQQGVTALEFAIRCKNVSFVTTLLRHMHDPKPDLAFFNLMFQRANTFLTDPDDKNANIIKQLIWNEIQRHPDTITSNFRKSLQEYTEKGLFLEAWTFANTFYGRNGSTYYSQDNYCHIFQRGKDSEVAYHLADCILLDTDFMNLESKYFNKTSKIQLLLCLLAAGKEKDQEHFLLRRALNYLIGQHGKRLPSLNELFSELDLAIDPNNIDYEKLILGLNAQFNNLYELETHLFSQVMKLIQVTTLHPDETSLQKIFDIEKDKEVEAKKAEENRIKAKRAQQEAEEKEREAQRIAKEKAAQEELARRTQLIHDVKKIYTALNEGLSGVVKTNFFANLSDNNINLVYSEIMVQAEKYPAGKMHIALNLAKQHAGKVNQDNIALFKEIYSYSYQNSGLFGKSNLPNNGDLKKEDIDNAITNNPNSRTAKISKALM